MNERNRRQPAIKEIRTAREIPPRLSLCRREDGVLLKTKSPEHIRALEWWWR